MPGSGVLLAKNPVASGGGGARERSAARLKGAPRMRTGSESDP
jgi:hypothetical protein